MEVHKLCLEVKTKDTKWDSLMKARRKADTDLIATLKASVTKLKDEVEEWQKYYEEDQENALFVVVVYVVVVRFIIRVRVRVRVQTTEKTTTETTEKTTTERGGKRRREKTTTTQTTQMISSKREEP